jgi:hypothetical protein
MCADQLKRQHLTGELVRRHLVRGDLVGALADLVILAEDAAEVAVGKENRTRATVAGYGWLFPEVQANVSYPGQPAGPADALLSGQTIHAAMVGAEIAGREMLPKRKCTSFNL